MNSCYPWHWISRVWSIEDLMYLVWDALHYNASHTEGVLNCLASDECRKRLFSHRNRNAPISWERKKKTTLTEIQYSLSCFWKQYSNVILTKKPVLDTRTTKAQIRLRIRTIWSGPSLSAYKIIIGEQRLSWWDCALVPAGQCLCWEDMAW